MISSPWEPGLQYAKNAKFSLEVCETMQRFLIKNGCCSAVLPWIEMKDKEMYTSEHICSEDNCFS